MFHTRYVRGIFLGCCAASGKGFVLNPAGHVIALRQGSSTTGTPAVAALVKRPRCRTRRLSWALPAGICGNHNDEDVSSHEELRDSIGNAGDERAGTTRASTAAAAVVGIAATTAAAALFHPSLAGAADAVADTFGESCSQHCGCMFCVLNARVVQRLIISLMFGWVVWRRTYRMSEPTL